MDSLCLAFAGWTLLCHAVVFSHGSLLDLLWLVGAAALVLAVVAAALLRGRSPGKWWTGVCGDSALCHEFDADSAVSFESGSRALCVGLAAVAITGYAMNSYWAFWLAIAAYALVALAISWARPIRVTPAGVHRRDERILWLLCGLAALLTLVAHRPDIDDTFYQNLAVGIADFPEQALLEFDTMLGIPDLPIHRPVYRVHSLEIWVGGLSFASGFAAIAISHWWVAGVAGFLVPIAFAQLFRLSGERRWLWGVVAALLFLVFEGSQHAGYGNLAFVRLHQGKGIFLSVLAPLLLAYGLRFACRPTLLHWILLAALQIAAIGTNATALWVAPVLASLGLAAGWRPNARSSLVLGAGVLASAYPVGMGLALRSGMQAVTRRGEPLDLEQGIHLIEQSIEAVLGPGAQCLSLMAVMLLAWPLATSPAARRWVATTLGCFSLLLLNPFLVEWVSDHVTSRVAYWRILWLVPLPALVGLVAIRCRQLGDLPRAPRHTGPLAYAGALALLLTWVPTNTTLSERNHTQLDLPRLKVPAGEYAGATLVNLHAPARSHILAPPEVSLWMTTQHHHAYPLLHRPVYMASTNYVWMDERDVNRREGLMNYVGGRIWHHSVREVFKTAFDVYGLGGVCLSTRAEWLPEMRAALASGGFEKAATAPGYELWLRSQ